MPSAFSNHIASFLARELASFALTAERFQLLWFTVVVGPVCVVAAFFGFPLLGRWSYTTWHLACLLCLIISAGGIATWIAQCVHRRRRSPFIPLFLLLVSATGAVICLVFGDFYWAFSRGFLLD